MAIRAVVFDIGGVLEITPRTGWVEKWEARLHLKPAELDERLMDVWRAGTAHPCHPLRRNKSVNNPSFPASHRLSSTCLLWLRNSYCSHA